MGTNRLYFTVVTHCLTQLGIWAKQAEISASWQTTNIKFVFEVAISA